MKKHLFLSVFSVFFALFGGVGVAHAANLPECEISIPVVELDGTFEGERVENANISGFDMRVYLSNGQTMHTTAFCSNGDDPASTPDESTGKYCWCGLDGYTDADGHTYTSSIPTWVFITDDYSSYSDCEAGCASKCFDRISEDLSEFGKFCLTFKEECGGTTTIGGIDGTFYDATPLEPTVSSPDWELRFDGGQVVYGTSFCSFANTDFQVPSTVAGQHCWCGISQYVDGANNTYNSIPETWWYQGDMTDMNTCNDECASACADQYGTKSRIQIDEEIGICYNSTTHNVTYVCGSGTSIPDPTGYFPGDNPTALGAGRCGTPPNGYSAFNNWSCNNNIGTVSGGGTFTMPAADVTCAAQWTPNIYTIRLRNYTNTSTHSTIYEKYNTGWYSNSTATTPLSKASVPTRSGYTFRGFYTATQSDLTASGGSGTRVITQTGGLPANNTYTANTDLYAAWARSCSTGTGCKCTLNINSNGTVTYATSAQSGYTLTSGSGTYAPVCSAIDYTVSFGRGNAGAGGTMSSQTGKHIGDTITLPANSFTPPSGYVFDGWNCDNNIGNKAVGSTFPMPAANVTCAAQWAQQITYPFTLTTTNLSAGDTFQFRISAAGIFYVDCGDDGILSGPSGSGVSGDTITKSNTNEYTYTCTYSSAGAKTIQFGGAATGYRTDYVPAIKFNLSYSPDDANVKKISSISGSLGQIFGTVANPSTGSGQPRFNQAFRGASNMTGTNIPDPNNTGMNYALPPTLFDGISGQPTISIFNQTFQNCSGLSGSIPSGLFGNLTGAPADYMFQSTFAGCSGLTGSIPSGLFGNLTGAPATNMFYETFRGCSGLTGFGNKTYVPGDFLENITTNTSVSDQTTNMFSGTQLANPCPANTYASTRQQFNDAGKPWCTECPSGTTSPAGSTSASQCVHDYKFSLTTTSLSANGTFQFTMSAQGTFYVDCGDDGILSGPSGSGVSGDTITKSDTNEYTYTCTYSSAGAKTIQFGGAATAYSNSPYASVIRFTSPTLVDAISGDLSQIFPESVSVGSSIPRFVSTFEGCSNLVSIPDTLFSQYTKTGQYMFWYTFKDCTGLGTSNNPSVVPMTAGLFSGITGFYTSIPQAGFYGTFQGCTGLTSIPKDLFLGIRNSASAARNTFSSTFQGCTGLTSIPKELFSGITTAGQASFTSTFQGCTSLTSIPEELFSSITTVAQSLFSSTFQGCTGLTSIPSGLFGNLSGSPAQGMFYETFRGCSGLTGFGNKTYVPGDFLENITTNTSVSNQATNMFYGTQLANPCPANTYASTRQQFNDAKKPWCTECPSGTTSPAGSTSASQCVVPFTVTYTCGSGVSGTAPTDTNSYTPNSTVHTVESFGTCSKDGYYASGWVCDGTSVASGGTFTITANTTCVAQWTGNGISLTWDGGGTPSSCTYGGTFVPPTPATRTGYVFTGWKLRNCFQSLDASISSTATYYYSITNTCCINTACTSGYCSNANFSGLSTGDWKVFFDYGTVVGTSICSETSGTSGTVGTPSATSGSYCWCAATDYTSINSRQPCSVNNPIWVSRGTVNNCANNCAYRCADSVKSQSGFRTALFGQSQ